MFTFIIFGSTVKIQWAAVTDVVHFEELFVWNDLQIVYDVFSLYSCFILTSYNANLLLGFGKQIMVAWSTQS